MSNMLKCSVSHNLAKKITLKSCLPDLNLNEKVLNPGLSMTEKGLIPDLSPTKQRLNCDLKLTKNCEYKS